MRNGLHPVTDRDATVHRQATEGKAVSVAAFWFILIVVLFDFFVKREV